MLGRRFLLLVAVLMGLTALAASLAPRDPALRSAPDERPRATPTPQAVEPSATATARTIQREISADDPRPQRVVVTEGDIIELEVSSSEVGSVSLMDEVEPVEPESNARFNVLADRVGNEDITLVDSGRLIGVLEVQPGS